MAEYVRSISVRVEVDTNKQTYIYEDDEFNPGDIMGFLLNTGALADPD